MGILDLGNSKAVTCLASSADGYLLVSGSEDGMVRVWDTRTRNITRVFRHTKGMIHLTMEYCFCGTLVQFVLLSLLHSDSIQV